MAQLPNGTLIGGIDFDTNDGIGAGGYVTDIAAAADGTLVCQGDGTGPRIRRPDERKWRRLLRPGINISIEDFDGLVFGTGGYAIDICWTNSDVIYFISGGGEDSQPSALFKTVDGGDTVTVTSLTGIVGAKQNEQTRIWGKPLRVDPNNPDVLFVGTRAGLKYTDDGGDSFTTISTGTIPAPIAALDGYTRYIVCFDRTSAVVGGKTQGIYVFVCRASGSGLYRTTNGGTSWSNVSGGPSDVGRMDVSPHDGYVHMAGNQGNVSLSLYYRWDRSSWINGTAQGAIIGPVCCDPNTPGKIVGCRGNTQIQVSIDNGVTWTGDMQFFSQIALDVSWQQWSQANMSMGNLVFQGKDAAGNPSGRLWAAHGNGTSFLESVPDAFEYLYWYISSAGIENMTMTSCKVLENGTLAAWCQDYNGFIIPRDEFGVSYPSRIAGTRTGLFKGNDIASPNGDPDALLISLYGTKDCISTDGGGEWSDTPVNPIDIVGGSGGGNVVMFSATVWIKRMTYAGPVCWTKDGGQTFTEFSEFHRPHHAYPGDNTNPLFVDPYVDNQAWLYMVASEAVGGAASPEDLAIRGMWRINYNPTTQSMSMTRTRTGYIHDNNDWYHNHFYWIEVDRALFCGSDNNLGLWEFTGEFATRTEVTGTDDVLGAAKFAEVTSVASGPGRVAGERTIMACGFRAVTPATTPDENHEFGYWFSEGVPGDDLGDNWTRLFIYPGGIYSAGELAADPDIYGLFYVAFGSEGVARIRYQDKRAFS